jgi:hypothetical protein
VFFSLPSCIHILRSNLPSRPHTGTIKNATAAKVAVFTCALDIETEWRAPIHNADTTTSGKEENLANVRRFFLFVRHEADIKKI